MGDLNTAGRAQQHQNVGGGLQLGGQHAHIGQHDAQGGDDAGGRAVTGTHDLRHRYLVGLADLARNEIQQDDADGRGGKGQRTYPRSAGVHHAGRAGDTAAAAPSGQQAAHQNDEGDLVSAGHHIVGGLDFLVGDYQAVDHQQHQISPNCDDIAHLISLSFTEVVCTLYYESKRKSQCRDNLQESYDKDLLS